MDMMLVVRVNFKIVFFIFPGAFVVGTHWDRLREAISM